LLELRRTPQCGPVKALALALALTQLTELQRKVESLRAVAELLHRLMDHCPGDDRPNCPILAALTLGHPAGPLHDPGSHQLRQRYCHLQALGRARLTRQPSPPTIIVLLHHAQGHDRFPPFRLTAARR
jgi:hypothetical protein